MCAALTRYMPKQIDRKCVKIKLYVDALLSEILGIHRTIRKVKVESLG